MWLAYVAYHQMVQIQLFRVLVVRFVLSLMVLEILFDITTNYCLISQFWYISKVVKNQWNCKVSFFMSCSQHNGPVKLTGPFLADLRRMLRMSYCALLLSVVRRRPSVVRLSSVHTFERLLLWNPWDNFFQTSYVAFC